MGLEVRGVRPEEYEAAGAVTALAYEEFGSSGVTDWAEYRRRIADVASRASHTLVLVAVEEGRILGTVTLELDGRVPGGHERPTLGPRQAHVRMLGVHPEARGRGIAKALMRACIAHARRAGKSFITLDTTEQMKAAQHLYEAMGFRRRPDLVFDDGFRLRMYELPLSASRHRD
jgi:ribosomal protein S18 acetylase RimI-like enzyme